ncbi:MAG: hypothetical protein DWQ01_11310 [Planctomycetota bacterium]|nr:MAG: hypothetical protein DWQ01_11310 [Planctomycetota bacterium]
MKFSFHPTFRNGLLVCLSLLVVGPAPGQRIGGEWALKYQIFGEQELGFFGDDVAGPGDLDGDGFSDFIVGAPIESFDNGAIYAYSGKSGNLLWEWTIGGWTGFAVSGAGDVNGDGAPDVVVGSPNLNTVTILLNDGTVWWTKSNGFAQLGRAVASLGDVNLDGFDDVIVGADRTNPQGMNDAGSVFVYSGLDGTRLFRFNGAFPGDRFGLSVAGAGDTNADGCPDILVGTIFADRGGFSKVGVAYLYSGNDGTLLYEYEGLLSDGFLLGGALSGAGDLNKDGYDDFLISAPGADHSFIDAGTVFVYSGQDGNVMFQVSGTYNGDFFGEDIDSLTDSDFDGIPEIVISSLRFPVDLGRFEVRSGADGRLLDTIVGTELNAGLGRHIATVGDIEGNGLDAVIAGLRAMDNGGIDSAGAVQVFSPNPFIFADATELSASSGVPVQVLMSFPESEANAKYALLLSGAGTGPTTIAGLEVPLGQSLLLSQMLTGWAPFNLHGAFGTLDANAQATATLDSDPTLAGLVGTTFYMAAVTYDSSPALAGRRTSIAWPIRITL